MVEEVAGEVHKDFRGVIGGFEGFFDIGTSVPVNLLPGSEDYVVHGLVVEEVS